MGRGPSCPPLSAGAVRPDGANERRRKLDRANFFDMAAGSAQELRMALTLAVVFGHLEAGAVECIDRMIDRELGMLWKLARRSEQDAKAARRAK